MKTKIVVLAVLLFISVLGAKAQSNEIEFVNIKTTKTATTCYTSGHIYSDTNELISIKVNSSRSAPASELLWVFAINSGNLLSGADFGYETYLLIWLNRGLNPIVLDQRKLTSKLVSATTKIEIVATETRPIGANNKIEVNWSSN